MLAEDIFSVEGKVVTIGGASRGLGKAVALAFGQRGALVTISSWNAVELKATQTEFAKHGVSVHCVSGDISLPEDCSAIVEKTLEAYSRIDVMICNAAIDVIKDAETYSADEWDKVLDINLRGTYLCAKAAALPMLKQGSGSIIVTSSIAGSLGIRGLAPYAASKGGANQLIRTMAVEWARRGVRVNGVAPGYIANQMEGVATDDSSEYSKRALSRTPMARRGNVSEFIGAYLYLASQASSYVTGEIMHVDGGYAAG